MTWLRIRMYLLVAALFGILYGVLVGLGEWSGTGSALAYLVLALAFLGIQYLVSPAIVGWTMKVRWVSKSEAPELHRMVAELAGQAGIPKPKVGISRMQAPNAFAYGRNMRDGRVCVTEGIMKLLKPDELRAVLGHEISHIRHRDMAIITLMSAIPLVLYWIAWSTMFGGFGNRRGGGYGAIIGLAAFALYFLTNLLVLYGSRIREYYADVGSVELGNEPRHMATALYKLVHGNARNRRSAEMRRVEGVRAFFLNDVARASGEVRELREIDRDMSGTINEAELMQLRNRDVNLAASARLMELFTTHPNMLKRIKHLSTLTT